MAEIQENVDWTKIGKPEFEILIKYEILKRENQNWIFGNKFFTCKELTEMFKAKLDTICRDIARYSVTSFYQ